MRSVQGRCQSASWELSPAASASIFKRSALQMYLGLRGASLALAFLAFATLVQVNQATKDPKTVCYFESWVHWRNGDGKVDPSEIDTTLCTHIVYSYFGIDENTHELLMLDPYLMKDLRK